MFLDSSTLFPGWNPTGRYAAGRSIEEVVARSNRYIWRNCWLNYLWHDLWRLSSQEKLTRPKDIYGGWVCLCLKALPQVEDGFSHQDHHDLAGCSDGEIFSWIVSDVISEGLIHKKSRQRPMICMVGRNPFAWCILAGAECHRGRL